MILHNVKYADFQGFNIKPGDTQQVCFDSLDLFEPETKQKLRRRIQIYMDKTE